jgi:hypothetical protein
MEKRLTKQAEVEETDNKVILPTSETEESKNEGARSAPETGTEKLATVPALSGRRH